MNTPRDIIDRAQLETGNYVGSEQAVRLLREREAEIGQAHFDFDTWQVGGAMVSVNGERRVMGELAAYLVEKVSVTGRSLRYEMGATRVRVKVTIATEDGIEGGDVSGWMVV